ncbi:peptidoglycan-binding domain-containing protein [Frigidibacter sp. MR17.24]|uniref:peptidoglycan-binding domain-containing protein n=1 Tax=Frigidibacter sp. MR17.24 TaxID=3127345 RepID=UPI003012A6FC
MIVKRIATACLAGSLVLAPAGRVAADGKDAALGLIVGGILGGAIVNENNKARQREAVAQQQYRRNAASSAARAAQREQNREVQTALNYFGFPVGTPDGAFGPRTRSGISEMQAVLGYPPTGELTEYQRTLLVGSYHRGVASPQTMQLAAGQPMGMRGLLVAWRDEQMGIAAQPAMPVMPAQAMPAPAMPAPAMPSQAAPAVMAALPVVPGAAPAAGLPSFMGGDIAQASLASQCNKVSLMTSTNGGFVTAASLSDPNQALAEQFCLARTYAIAQGEEMAGRIQGFTPAQIAQQCQGFAPAMAAQVAAVAMQPANVVMSEVQGFAASSGMTPQQLISTAKICLSVGYRTDDMAVAISSGLLLASLGEAPYAELIGHHLSQGFGTSQRPDLALSWYDTAFDALGMGVTPVFAPGQPERTALVRSAAYRAGGRADPMAAPVPAALPSFGAPAQQSFVAPPALGAAPAGAAVPAMAVGATDGITGGAGGAGTLPEAAPLPLTTFGN